MTYCEPGLIKDGHCKLGAYSLAVFFLPFHQILPADVCGKSRYLPINGGKKWSVIRSEDVIPNLMPIILFPQIRPIVLTRSILIPITVPYCYVQKIVGVTLIVLTHA